MSSTSKKSDKRGFSRIIGLSALKNRLGNIILTEDNSCVLLTGPTGSGKRKLANLIAQAWLCDNPTENGACEECASCHHFDQNNHFDYKELKPEDGKRIIPTDDVRSELKDLIMLPRLGKYKVILIDADGLNEQGQNALLKALEEPLRHTRFVLTASDPSRLLLTVRSRVVSLRLDRRSEEEICQILLEELSSADDNNHDCEQELAPAGRSGQAGEQELASADRRGQAGEQSLAPAGGCATLADKDLTFYARFSAGLPGRALELAHGGWFRELRAGTADIYFSLDKAKELDLFTVGSDFFKEHKDQADTALNIIQSLIRDELCLLWGANGTIVNSDLQGELQAAYERKLAVLTKKSEARDKSSGLMRWQADADPEGFSEEERELRIRLTHAAEVVEESREALQRNVNFELIITRLLLHLKRVAAGEDLIESRKNEKLS